MVYDKKPFNAVFNPYPKKQSTNKNKRFFTKKKKKNIYSPDQKWPLLFSRVSDPARE